MLANTAEVEALAANMGFTVLSPEQLDWKQQVSLLAGSRVVVGEHGSAMKSLLFAPSGTIAVVLNYLNDSQAAIARTDGGCHQLRRPAQLLAGASGGHKSGFGHRALRLDNVGPGSAEPRGQRPVREL